MQKKPKTPKLMLTIIALAALVGSALLMLPSVHVFAQSAPDITGAWQGTLTLPAAAGGRELRTVIKISKADGGALKLLFYSIDQGAQSIPGTATLQGPTVKMTIPGIGGSYEGKLDSDGVNLTGNFTQGPNPLPLNLKHVTDATAWEIPKPPPPAAKMPADANPSFEVATIKPSKPGTQGKGITMRDPRTFMTINFSVVDLMTFAYGIHPRQISGGPDWLESEHYDIQATPDPPGMPSRKQLETMVQKLLADRFKLAFHHDKKELSVFALVLGKTGSKLTASTGDPTGLPGLGFRKLGDLAVRNANMSDFTGLMQSSVLDRPVVDQTGLSGRFDFTLKWTPDETQFSPFGGYKAPATEEKDAPPDLFTAIQQQLGLKLESTKTAVDVLVIDHVEKPSEN
jgi:uncharacterized protein (TIGR03435 family)